MPSISVIVPVYNVEQYLNRCVDSILSQTYKNFEVILVDDGSTDNSGMICDEYAIIDNRVRVIHQKNAGQSNARNNAIKIANGEWIHFVDSDDLIHPQMLELLYNATIKSSANICCCNYIESEIVNDTFFTDYSQNLHFNISVIDENTLIEYRNNKRCFYWIVWAKLIKKTIIEKNLFTEGKFYEDNALACKWLYDAKVVAEIDLPLYFYQTNYSSTTKSSFSLKQLDYLWALEEQISFYEDLKYYKLLRETLISYFEISNSYYYLVLNKLNNKSHANSIRKNYYKMYKFYCEKFDFPEEVSLNLFKMYFHKLSYFLTLKQSYHDVGIIGILKRIFRKI